jgi:hypothetical protein
VKIVARLTALPQVPSFPGVPLLRGAPLPAKEPAACRMTVGVAVAAESLEGARALAAWPESKARAAVPAGARARVR